MIRVRSMFTCFVLPRSIIMANFVTEDYSDISIEDLEDWNDLVLHPHEDEIGVSTTEITPFVGESEDVPSTSTSCSISTSSKDPSPREPEAKKKKSSSSSTSANSGKPGRTATTKAYFRLPPEAREELQSSGRNIMKGIIEGVSSDDQFAGKHGYGTDVRKLASNILSKENTDSFESLSEYITCLLDLVNSLGKTPIGAALQDETFKKFHEFRMSKERKKNWDNFFTINDFHPLPIVDNILYQYVLEKLLDLVVVRVGAYQKPEQEVAQKGGPEDSDHDAQVLRYIAGFIPYALLKRYKRSRQPLAKEYAAILQSWKAAEDNKTMAPSFLSYTVAWIEMQNRGGLFCVTDDVFRLFWAMEKASKDFLHRRNLNALKNTNVKDTLTDKCVKDKFVLKLWNTLTSSCSHKTNMQPLFITIVNYWMKIRIHAFVKASNLLLKTKKKTSLKGEKSLRKELVKS